MAPHSPKESSAGEKKFTKCAQSNWKEKGIEKGKTKYLSTEEVKKMESGDQRSVPARSCTVRKNKAVQDIEASYAKKQKEMAGTTETATTLSPANALASTENTVKTNGELPKKLSREESEALLAVYSQPAHMLGFKPTKNPEPSNPDVENIFQKAAAEETLPTDPAPIASWKGNFIVKDKNTAISFRAYPTVQGLSKVREFSKKMPTILKFELLWYDSFLRNVFKGDDPNEKDIGLYIFPDNMERLESYVAHLEQLYGKVVMRSCIGEVDFLVFTSKVLRRDSPKWNNREFLWGLYRHSRHQKLDCAEEDNNVIDMEVNMIGGVPVGRLDVVISC